MLVDQSGKIVYKGHPATRPDLEADLTALGKGETLTGEGIAAAADKADTSTEKSDEIPQGWSEMDNALILKELEAFTEVAKGF